MLSISGLAKSYGGLRVTCDISIDIARGERHLLIGPNGAGKTTLFNLISGDVPPDHGRIVIDAVDMTRMATAARVQHGVARTYQIITLFERDTLRSNVMLSLLGKTAGRWLPWGRLERGGLYAKAFECLRRVGLESKADLPLAHTSYGEKRRLEIAMALAQEPRLLLLDEPLAGLSAEERETVTRVLREIPRHVTVLLIEHDMDVALSLADRVTLLHQGAVVATGSREEIANHPKTREVYLGQ